MLKTFQTVHQKALTPRTIHKASYQVMITLSISSQNLNPVTFAQLFVSSSIFLPTLNLPLSVEPEVFRVTGLMSFKAVGQSVVLSVTVNGSPVPTADDISWHKMDERSIPMPITHNR